jgi:GNAT superfamily N-acetyltransferase
MIRLATPNDAREIAEFVVDIRLDTVPMVHDAGGVEWFIRNRLLPRGSSFVFVENGVVIGWVDVHDDWLNQLYCKRGYTGKGIGLQLLNFAKSKSPEGLQLWTFQVNLGARKFYAREGFQEVELTNVANNEEKQPDVRMEWRP